MTLISKTNIKTTFTQYLAPQALSSFETFYNDIKERLEACQSFDEAMDLIISETKKYAR